MHPSVTEKPSSSSKQAISEALSSDSPQSWAEEAMNTPARPINELEGFEDFMSESDEGTTEPIFVKKRGEKKTGNPGWPSCCRRATRVDSYTKPETALFDLRLQGEIPVGRQRKC